MNQLPNKFIKNQPFIHRPIVNSYCHFSDLFNAKPYPPPKSVYSITPNKHSFSCYSNSRYICQQISMKNISEAKSIETTQRNSRINKWFKQQRSKIKKSSQKTDYKLGTPPLSKTMKTKINTVNSEQAEFQRTIKVSDILRKGRQIHTIANKQKSQPTKQKVDYKKLIQNLKKELHAEKKIFDKVINAESLLQKSNQKELTYELKNQHNLIRQAKQCQHKKRYCTLEDNRCFGLTLCDSVPIQYD